MTIKIQTVVECDECKTKVALPPSDKVEKKAARAAAAAKGWITISRRGKGTPVDICPECREGLPVWIQESF